MPYCRMSKRPTTQHNTHTHTHTPHGKLRCLYIPPMVPVMQRLHKLRVLFVGNVCRKRETERKREREYQRDERKLYHKQAVTRTQAYKYPPTYNSIRKHIRPHTILFFQHLFWCHPLCVCVCMCVCMRLCVCVVCIYPGIYIPLCIYTTGMHVYV